MKRVGILTVHKSLNYGAVLQAYALNNVLIKNGYDAQIVNYISEAVEEREHKSSFTVKGILKYIIRANKYCACKHKERKFRDFMKNYYVLSEKTYRKSDIQDSGSVYDYFVTGSDQIWNFDITNYDTVFMLDFVTQREKKKSYAASFGYEAIPEAYKERTKEMLSEYSSLLVREYSGVQILHQLGLSGKVVLDPTLLMDSEQWFDMVRPYHGEKYVLVYTVAAPTHLYDAAREMGKKLGVKVKIIKLEPTKNQPGMEQIYDADPRNFVTLIKNAECVFTTSFHGLAFSLNLGTEVFFEADSSKNKNTTRLTHLAEMLGVMNRRIESSIVTDFSDNPIDWTKVQEKLQSERKKSTKYLLESLQYDR
ncbi:MAG: polysaccharide pyruvyl transferase family protein [Lachnospiraceae bacterium]|nr:polysaccharide pyruvyl transferase family protein [Lachnospiraceae bacterium]